MHPALEEALNTQIREEFASAYTYLAMAAYVEAENYPGIAHWLKRQAVEESEHAMRFFEFLLDRGGKVRLREVPQPAAEPGTIEDVFKSVLEHEKRITQSINNLYAIAMEHHDYPSIPFLQGFITEQVEEEKSAADALVMIARAGNSPQALLMIDHKLGSRE
ncbi:MAG TPA: ferritin [Symbiobacteriaceae bacterium]|nr:ferritin [Symbiobacteriaceae bacterium]